MRDLIDRSINPQRCDDFIVSLSLDPSKNRNNWIGYSKGKKIRIRMHVCQNLLKATRDLSTRSTSTYVYSRNGLYLETRIGSRMKNTMDGGKSEADDKTEKSRGNGWPSNATFKSQVWKVGERWSCIGCQVATQVLLANLSLSRWGTFFRRELRQCGEGAYVRPSPPTPALSSRS